MSLISYWQQRTRREQIILTGAALLSALLLSFLLFIQPTQQANTQLQRQISERQQTLSWLSSIAPQAQPSEKADLEALVAGLPTPPQLKIEFEPRSRRLQIVATNGFLARTLAFIDTLNHQGYPAQSIEVSTADDGTLRFIIQLASG